jgi:hypothetical protein
MTTMPIPSGTNHNQFYDYEEFEDKLKFIAKFGMYSPSRNNTRPWKIEVRGREIHVYADMSKRLDAVDPYNREMFISLGCVLANIEITAEYYDLSYSTYIFSGKITNNLVAIINFPSNKLPKTQYPVSLFHTIPIRYVNRSNYARLYIKKKDLDYIENSVNWIEGISVYISNNQSTKNYLAELTFQAEQEQFDNTLFRQEMLHWIKTNNKREGLPLNAFHFSPVNNIVFSMYKNYNFGIDKEEFDKELIENSPYIGILMSESDSMEDWVSTGVAFQVLALCATSLGLAYHPMTSILELPYYRNKVRDLIESTKVPQMFFRLGYPSN